MIEYKVVYWEDVAGEFTFGISVTSKFEKEINQLSLEGWVVKFSNIATFAIIFVFVKERFKRLWLHMIAHTISKTTG